MTQRSNPHARRLRRSAGAVALGLVAGLACAAHSPVADAAAGRAASTAAVEIAYDGKLGAGWSDYGWSPTRVLGKGPAQIEMSEQFGWIVAKPGAALQGALLDFRYRLPQPVGRFLRVALTRDGEATPRQFSVANFKSGKDGWVDVSMPIAKLNPKKLAFDRILFQGDRRVNAPFVVQFDKVRIIGATDAASSGSVAASTSASTSAAPGAVAKASGTRATTMSIDCAAQRKPISPLIYGIGFSGSSVLKQDPWSMQPAANRWGGNPTSRYNWEVNAWNTANDYFFRNVGINDAPNAAQAFLDNNERLGITSALTIPMIGWVAKDASSYSFPVSVFGPQQYTDPDLGDPGNGVAKNGSKIDPGPPTRTSVAAPPEFVGKWVAAIKGRVGMYFLDNEPDLWDSTQRDVHPDPLTYDELLDRSIRYGTAVRQADPSAVIAGPSSWGWPAYFFSGADAKAGFDKAPDRKAHGGQALIPWYLQQMRAAEKRTGVHLLDVLDVHFYPQAANVGGGGGGSTDPETNALRLRQTRGLWDPTYRDESWIGEPIELIPRMQKWIADSAPGLGISIGEWNFGGEGHMSGGLATAEALGRFGEGGVRSAFYWTAPPNASPSYWAFRAFRNVDGKGLRFRDVSVASNANTAAGASAASLTSLFASTDASTSKLTAVIVNMDPANSVDASIALAGCKTVTSFRTFTYDGSMSGFQASAATVGDGRSIALRSAAYSITFVAADLG